MNKLNRFLFLALLAVLALACNMVSAVTPASPAGTSEAPAAATDIPTDIPVIPTDTSTPPGSIVTLNNVTFTIPQGLARDALGETIPAINDPNAAPWDIPPAHMEFTLTSYQLQDKFHQPKIYVIPAEEYASLNEGAAKNIQYLKTPNIEWTVDILPHVPFFNAGQVFAAQIQPIAFQSGSGVRFLTVYAQYYASINNRDLFYQFQGLTSDGKNYIIAILPVTAPMLALDEKPDAPVPADGVPFPGYDSPDADFTAYYNTVSERLNAANAESFTPTLAQLDALIQSITMTP